MVFRKDLSRIDAGTYSGGESLVEKPEEPEGDDLSVPTLDTGEGIADVGLDASRVGRDDTEPSAIDEERGVTVASAHVVVGPEGILKSGLEDIRLLHAVGIDGVHQIAVVHHHAGRFLGESFAGRVDQIDETCVGEVFDVVHHGGP